MTLLGITSPLSQEELGERLRDARERADLSRAAVAEVLDTSPDRIQRVEAGEEAISAAEVLDLADLFDVQHRDLIQGEAPEDDLLAIFRGNALLEREEIQSAVYEAYDICRVVEELRDLLGRGGPFRSPHEPPSQPQSWEEARTQGRALAINERERLSLGFDPIRDLHGLLLDQGLGIGRIQLPPNVSGLYLSKKGALPFILLNEAESDERRRFSLAHEYCHALIDVRDGVQVSRKGDESLTETRANAFAGNLLLPRRAVEEFAAERDKVPSGLTFIDAADLAYEFNLSYEATLVRLKLGGFLTQSEYDEWSSKSRQAVGYLANEYPVRGPTPWDVSLRQWALSLILDAYEEEVISHGRALELADRLGLSQTKMETSLQAVANEGASGR